MFIKSIMKKKNKTTFTLKITIKDIDPNQDLEDDYLEKCGPALVKSYVEQVINERVKEYYDIEIENIEINVY